VQSGKKSLDLDIDIDIDAWVGWGCDRMGEVHRVERNTFINSLQFVQIAVTLRNIFEQCVFAIGDRCSEPVFRQVPA